ncbi:MAG: RsmD family RNA methyltransferase [Verrucomicrobia bacterium]|nr:RsmD family RNA methyltransferase [Verrucomicrobiota bacterium]
MRVISGSAGGVPLKAPSRHIRPTMDLVREAVFSALGERVLHARILDLFAGSGSFGIEALSRGAAETTFVERGSIEALRLNLLKTRLSGMIIREDVFRFLRHCQTTFDIVFADPPYTKSLGDRDFAAEVLQNPFLLSVLNPTGILILERSPKNDISDLWISVRSKRYGETEILFLEPATRTGDRS